MGLAVFAPVEKAFKIDNSFCYFVESLSLESNLYNFVGGVRCLFYIEFLTDWVLPSVVAPEGIPWVHFISFKVTTEKVSDGGAAMDFNDEKYVSFNFDGRVCETKNVGESYFLNVLQESLARILFFLFSGDQSEKDLRPRSRSFLQVVTHFRHWQLLLVQLGNHVNGLDAFIYGCLGVIYRTRGEQRLAKIEVGQQGGFSEHYRYVRIFDKNII